MRSAARERAAQSHGVLIVIVIVIVEYTNRIPNPKHMPRYTKAKVLHTQDKHTSAEQLCKAKLPLLLPFKKPCHS